MKATTIFTEIPGGIGLALIAETREETFILQAIYEQVSLQTAGVKYHGSKHNGPMNGSSGHDRSLPGPTEIYFTLARTDSKAIPVAVGRPDPWDGPEGRTMSEAEEPTHG